MKEIDLSKVFGGYSNAYDPDVCTMVTATGALVGGAVGTVAGSFGHIPNIGWTVGAAAGAGLMHHYSPACH